MTRPATGGSTFTVRAGSASTSAGSTSECETSFIAGSSTMSRVRNGEFVGTTMRSPTRENRAGVCARADPGNSIASGRRCAADINRSPAIPRPIPSITRKIRGARDGGASAFAFI